MNKYLDKFFEASYYIIMIGTLVLAVLSLFRALALGMEGHTTSSLMVLLVSVACGLLFYEYWSRQ